MIIEFSVENFRSIKERITFSMVASSEEAPEGKEYPETTASFDCLPSEMSLLSKISVIYGPNASGKSTLVEALLFLQRFIVTSHGNQSGDETGVTPFKFDPVSLESPTCFELTYLHNRIRYQYGLTLDSEKVIDEYLYYWPGTGKRRTTIFTRKSQDIQLPKKRTSGSKDEDEIRQKIYIEQTSENMAFLSQGAKLNHEKIKEAFTWIRSNIRIIHSNHSGIKNVTSNRIIGSETKPVVKKRILRYLSLADFSIVDIHINLEEDIPLHNLPEKIKKEILSKEALSELDASTKIRITALEEIFYHYGIDQKGKKIPIPLSIDEESAGTRQLYRLLGPIDYVLEEGLTLLVDEMDMRLHPLLAFLIIKLFSSPKTNPKNAQLIFTTHNVELLNRPIFRPDQIWFTEKNRKDDSTKLFSLWDFDDIQENADIKADYLQGRFGAIPYLKEKIDLW